MMSRMGTQKTVCLGAAICLFAAALFTYAPVLSDHPFGYDEADYVWAGKQGLWANFTDRNGLSIVEFVRKGIELAHDAGKRQAYSDFIRSSGDIEFYRHQHGPVYAYWLALLRDLGAQRETVFRGGSLMIHFATAGLILFGVWAVFPSLPPVAGLLAFALFLFNRSALTAGTIITQHEPFTFFCIASLLACSLFLRNLDTRWFYVTLALMAWALCTVETSILLLGALGVSMIVEHRRVRERWPTVKAFGGLLLRGAGVFLLAMLICWPMGLLKLAIAKSFLTLAYFALSSRSNYSPLSFAALWSEKSVASPWEFALLAPGVIAAFALWRRFAQRRELLPWLSFIAIFFLVTMKITQPYTYYYAPLTAALTVATGVAMGILWRRWPPAGRAALLLAGAVSVAGMAVQFHGVLRDIKEEKPYGPVVLRMLGEHPVEAGKTLYLPFQLVPVLHYYNPDIRTVGYDFDFPMPRLADGIASADAAGILFCEAAFCDGLERERPGFAAQKILLERPGPNGQAFYLIEIRKSGSR